MEAEIGPSPGQDDGRATILLHKGDTGEALAIWRELLPGWTARDEFDLQQPFSHRLAAVAAARLGEWTEAADWLHSARTLADEVKQAVFCAGLLVDEGFARWKGGDNGGALDCLVEGLTAVDQLPAHELDESAFLGAQAGNPRGKPRFLPTKTKPRERQTHRWREKDSFSRNDHLSQESI